MQKMYDIITFIGKRYSIEYKVDNSVRSKLMEIEHGRFPKYHLIFPANQNIDTLRHILQRSLQYFWKDFYVFGNSINEKTS